MSQIRQLDYSAKDLQEIYGLDSRRAMAIYFIAGAVNNMDSLQKIIETTADLIPGVATELRNNPPQARTVGTATALALSAAEEMVQGEAEYVFSDSSNTILLGAVLGHSNMGQGNDAPALIYDAQSRGFVVAAPATWEQRAQQSLNAVPEPANRGMSYAL